MQEAGEADLNKNKSVEDCFHILVVSSDRARVAQMLQVLLSRRTHRFLISSYELYRQAINAIHSPLGRRTVALVVTDFPDDSYAPSRGDVPLWKEAIAAFDNEYHSVFEKDIQGGYLPAAFTVISLFGKIKGKLPEEQLREIERECSEYMEEQQINHPFAWSDDELLTAMDKAVLTEIERLQNVIEQRAEGAPDRSSRTARLAKAKTLTKAAHKRQ